MIGYPSQVKLRLIVVLREIYHRFEKDSNKGLLSGNIFHMSDHYKETEIEFAKQGNNSSQKHRQNRLYIGSTITGPVTKLFRRIKKETSLLINRESFFAFYFVICNQYSNSNSLNWGSKVCILTYPSSPPLLYPVPSGA